MGKYQKLLRKILSGNADSNIPFDDLCNLLMKVGFIQRVQGSHHIFRRAGIEEMINLQKDSVQAKAYQVRAVRQVILKYNLMDATDAEI